MRKFVVSDWKAAQYNFNTPEKELPNEEKMEWFSASVPGVIQYDLISLNKLENPYSSSIAALNAAWVARSDWLYKSEFYIPQSVADMEIADMEIADVGTVILRLNGVDTYSEIWLNGKHIGETANAYRVYEFEIAPKTILSGKNTLLIRVKSHTRMIEDRKEDQERLCVGNDAEGLFGKAMIRRYQRSFFSGSSLLNLGTGVLGIGINQPVEFLFYPKAYISDCYFRTDEVMNNIATGTVSVCTQKAAEDTTIVIKITDQQGALITKISAQSSGGEQDIAISIKSPRLWWPSGYGEPYLYDMSVCIIQDGEIVDEVSQKIGIRTVELIRKTDTGRKTFFFKINDQKIFIHGQNHIPLDYMKVYSDKKAYDRLFVMLKNQHVNMVRIWGGGAVESRDFYERCDNMGILVWQDMFLHSNVYPDYDSDFVEEFIKESEGVIRRVRRHPCLFIICGGNEQIEGWEEWGWQSTMDRFHGGKLIFEELPLLSERLCPDIPYICNSPHGGKLAQSSVEGECHNWGNFYNSTKDPLFVTETCWTSESYSRPYTLKKYMDLDVNDYSGNDWAARWKERTGLSLFTRMPFSSWHEINTLSEYLHSLEIEQYCADINALSMFRFKSPSNNGVVYWSMNKGGPLFQFGCIDYGGFPMMSYYAVKRVYAPIAVKAYRDIGDVKIMLSCHAIESTTITIETFHMDKYGKILGHWEKELLINHGDLIRVMKMNNLYTDIVDRTEEFVYTLIKEKNEFICDDLLLFCQYFEYSSDYSPIRINIQSIRQNEWELRLSSDTP
ncbi:MAG: hypothetical protein LBD23_00320, partial [Oscillospiraceae bacterium]|nr:hypothetical protein [Oscillospiraceae bacterium]